MDANDLENALNNATSGGSQPSAEVSSLPTESETNVSMSKEEEIGFHKGALNTLLSERNELVKMVGNVEAIMQAHIERLKELGVDLKNGK